MASARHVIVAGAGIAGLTAALALARAGLRATVLEQAAKLEETGAGIQLVAQCHPRADRARPARTAAAVRHGAAGDPRDGGRLGARDRAHSARAATSSAATARPIGRSIAATCRPRSPPPRAAAQDVDIKLGTRVEDFAAHVNGVTVQGRSGQRVVDERGIALIGADGLWSTVRAQLQGATARRASATAPPGARWCRPRRCRRNSASRWCISGSGSTPISCTTRSRAGRLINIVGIVHDEWNKTGWSAAGDRAEILRHFARWSWAEQARALIAIPEQWLKWALYDRKTPFRGGVGPVTLIGDAAHPMLPFLAQGAGMAIEDAAVLADMLGKYLDDPADALRAYEGARWHRTARAQHPLAPPGPHLWAERPGSARPQSRHARVGRRKTARALRLAL